MGKTTVDASEGGDLVAETAGVHQDLSHHATTSCQQWVGSRPADMAGIAQCHCGDSPLPGLLDGEIGGKSRPHLAHGSMAIHDSGTGVLLDYLGLRLGLEPSLPNRLGVLVVAKDAVRIVSKEIGFNQMIHYRAAGVGGTPRPLRKVRSRFRAAFLAGIEAQELPC